MLDAWNHRITLYEMGPATLRHAGQTRLPTSGGWEFVDLLHPVSATRDGSVLTAMAFSNEGTLVVELREGEGTLANFGPHPGWEPHLGTLEGRNSSHRKISYFHLAVPCSFIQPIGKGQS